MALSNSDRVLVLQKIDKDKKDTSIIDPKVLEGKNPLHCFSNQGLWHFRYESGNVPGPLRNRYTTFKAAKEDAEIYFKSRNIQIVDVLESSNG